MTPDFQFSRPTSAFTLIEILLVLGIFGLMGLLVVSGTESLIARTDRTAEDIFWSAIETASRTAIESNRTVRLGSDQ